ncbi:YbaB/EbfC family nucleoid-associated protein [Saccharopolyspora sp. K220]|uniref:YbaB/EbfC family nucleoid-associated protein n=1 Tax=Saccharopolyspora soli TaxID=2926618 RepID=UPI001F5955F8|nr:YbaB/EbfC family nucleoid-associated protein [Saccharopolyspora soli]MCI2417108.1 YbaB/EbfC family nucleoid-associated protein [Saccharopolyspora soli]
MPADLDDMQRKLAALKEAGRRAEEQMGDFGRMREQISELQATATSEDRSVSVTASAGGVTGIQFTQDALRQSPAQLSNTVLGTLQQAVAEAARKQAEIVQEYVPDSDVLERILRTQDELFGAQVERPQDAPAHDDMPDSFLDGGR